MELSVVWYMIRIWEVSILSLYYLLQKTRKAMKVRDYPKSIFFMRSFERKIPAYKKSLKLILLSVRIGVELDSEKPA